MYINTTDEFDKLLSDKRVVLVDFWAPWCGPCRMLHPIIEQLKEKYPENILKVNVDQQRELASRYGIRGIPAVKIMNEDEILESMVGVQPGYVYEEKMKYYMNS